MDYTGIPKTSAIIFTGAGPLDQKSYIENYSDLANIDTKLLIQGQSIFCKETGKEYIYIGNKWIYKLCNYISDPSELNDLDENMLVKGQILTCTSNGGHYLYFPGETFKDTTPVVNSWYLKEQLEFDLQYPIGCTKILFSQDEELPSPIVAQHMMRWEVISDYDYKVLYPSSEATAGTIINQSITVENHTLTVQEIPAHNHYLSLNSSYGSGYTWGQVSWACGDTSRGQGTGYTSNSGGTQGHNHTISAGAKLDGVTIKIWKRTK